MWIYIVFWELALISLPCLFGQLSTDAQRNAVSRKATLDNSFTVFPQACTSEGERRFGIQDAIDVIFSPYYPDRLVNDHRSWNCHWQILIPSEHFLAIGVIDYPSDPRQSPNTIAKSLNGSTASSLSFFAQSAEAANDDELTRFNCHADLTISYELANGSAYMLFRSCSPQNNGELFTGQTPEDAIAMNVVFERQDLKWNAVSGADDTTLAQSQSFFVESSSENRIDSSWTSYRFHIEFRVLPQVIIITTEPTWGTMQYVLIAVTIPILAVLITLMLAYICKELGQFFGEKHNTDLGSDDEFVENVALPESPSIKTVPWATARNNWDTRENNYTVTREDSAFESTIDNLDSTL